MLGVIIPARNEEENIPHVLRSLAKLKIDPKDIYLIDSCSNDQTISVAKTFNINILTTKIPGYQNALSVGLKNLQVKNYDQFMIVDGDNEIRFEAIKKILAYQCSDFDFVIGRRPNIKRIGEKIVNYYFYKKFGIQDLMCGIKLGNINLFNIENKLQLGIDLFNFNKLNKIKNVDILITTRKETRLGNAFSVNMILIKNLIFKIFQLSK